MQAGIVAQMDAGASWGGPVKSILPADIAKIVDNRLVLDVETLPLKASLTQTYDPNGFSPPSNYGVEAALKWHVKNEQTWRAKLGKECSVNGRLGRVLCLGTSVGTFYAEQEDGERALLETFWELAHDAAGAVIGWNSQWDLGFLLTRSQILRVKPSVSVVTLSQWFKRYTTRPHFDCKAVLLRWPSGFSPGEGLDEWATAFGLPGKTGGVSGADVAWMYDEGQHQLIQDYCAQDVASTAAIFAAIAPYYEV